MKRRAAVTHVEHLREISRAINHLYLHRHLSPDFVHNLVESIILANEGHPERQIQLFYQAQAFAREGLDQRQIGDLFSA